MLVSLSPFFPVTETSIETTKREIEELKVQLEQERVVRQHKEEYEAQHLPRIGSLAHIVL